MTRLASNAYGKNAVKITRVVRSGDRHTLEELTVSVMLGGAFEAAYLAGDNAACIPTDTMKNTVYALARQGSFDSAEAFAVVLGDHFLQYPQVGWSEVSVTQQPWERIPVGGAPHPHAFTRGGSGRRTCRRLARRGEPARTWGGMEGLEVIKTARSAFRGFFRDRYTTLADASDRILATTIDVDWELEPGSGPAPELYETGRRCILETFAAHDSASVQQTLYAIGEALLERMPPVGSVEIRMPNQHRILVDLSPFGLDNPNEIFVTTNEPFGLITGTVTREGRTGGGSWEG